MKLLVRKKDGVILDASNVGAWEHSADTEMIVEVDACAERFDWPNGYPSRCLWNGKEIIANAAYADISVEARRCRDINLSNTEEIINLRPSVEGAQHSIREARARLLTQKIAATKDGLVP